MNMRLSSDPDIDCLVDFASSSSDRKYVTTVWRSGKVTCNCPGWTRRVDKNGGRQCKHTLEVANNIEAARIASQKPKWYDGQTVGQYVKELTAYNERRIDRAETLKVIDQAEQAADALLKEAAQALEKPSSSEQARIRKLIIDSQARRMQEIERGVDLTQPEGLWVDERKIKATEKPKPIVKPLDRVKRKFEL